MRASTVGRREGRSPAPTRTSRLALALPVALALAAGCGTFDDPSTVEDLRVLAVAAQPSEVILGVTSPADVPGVTIPPIALTPLVVDPAGRPISVTLSVCANDPTAPASPYAIDDPTGYPAGGARTTVGSALCDGSPSQVVLARDIDLRASPQLSATLDPAWLLSAFMGDVFLGADGAPHGGFDLGMPVVFQVTARAGGDTVMAVKRTIFWTHAVRADQTPNTTPIIPGVRAYARRDEATAEPIADAVTPLDPDATLEVPEGGLWIDPVSAGDPATPAVAEEYVTATVDRLTNQVVPIDVKETLSYLFYASAGTFSPFQTSSEPASGVTPRGRVHFESKYHPPPATMSPADVTIWIVVRDDRGGSSWVTRTLHVPGPIGP